MRAETSRTGRDAKRSPIIAAGAILSFLLSGTSALLLTRNAAHVVADRDSGGPAASYFPLVVKHHNRAIEPIGQFGGLPSAIAWAEPYAYVAAGPKLAVLDIANPINVVTVGESAPAPGRVIDLEVQGGHAYAHYVSTPDLSQVQHGIRIYDVRDPLRPRLASDFVPPDWLPGEMAVQGRRLFVLEQGPNVGRGTARVIDVSDPALPREVGAIPRALISGTAVRLAATPGFVFLVSQLPRPQPDGSRGRLSAVDIRDLAAPKVVATVDLPRDAKIVQLGQRLFVVDETMGLTVVDIADPASMQAVAVRDANALGIVVLAGEVQELDARADGYLFGRCFCRFVAAPGSSLTPRMFAIDVRDPAHPRPAVEVAAAISGTTTHVASFDHRVMHLNRYDGSIYVAAVPDPNRPAVVRRILLPSALKVEHIAVSASSLHATGLISLSPHLIALDLRDPTSPRLSWAARRLPHAIALAAADDALYVVQDDGLHVLHTRSTTRMTESAHLLAQAQSRDVAPADGRLYVVESAATVVGSRGGLRVFDIAADPLHPHEIGSIAGDFTTVAVAGPLAWVASVARPPQPSASDDGTQDLQVFDISDPARIRLLASFAYPMAENEIDRIAATADEAFVAQGGQLFRHRLSRDLARIPIVTVMDEVIGGFALHASTLIAHARGRLTAFDIRQSPHPAPLGAYAPRGSLPSLFPPAVDMAVVESRVFISTAEMGVWVFDVGDFVRAP